MAPGGLTFSVDGATVVLQWSAPTVFVATSYVIEAGSSSGQIDQANTNIGNLVSYTASPVPPGTYYVRVRAMNNGVASPKRSSSSAHPVRASARRSHPPA
jgi:hypothetical protein